MKKEYTDRLNHIEQTKILLKKKFIGLDKFIDNVIEQVIPWYVFKITTETPIVINIWGITGTGKSEFVQTLCELLDVRTIVFDSQSFLSTMNRVGYTSSIEQEPNSAIIIEEFHRIKTLREQDDTIINDQRYILWEMMSGTLNVRHEFYQVNNLFIGHDRKRWTDHLDSNRESKMDFIVEILDSLKRYERYPLSNNFIKEIESYASETNTETFLKKCEELVQSLPISRKVSSRQNIIFVVGNLDGAYKRVVEDLEVLEADDVSERMSKITKQECKESLLKMFSPEQVARLGANHFVMPTLTKQGYQDYIKGKVTSLIDEYSTKHETYFYVDNSVYEMLYSQIVIPTQGLRNVISGLNNLFFSPMLVGLSKIMPNVGKEPIVVEYKDNKLILSSDKITIVQPIDLLNQQDHYSEEFLKLVSIHEAGHATVYFLLTGKAPEKVVAVTNSSKMGGYIKQHKRDFDTKLILKNNVKVALAGFFAEKVILGEENISTGSYSDLIKASTIVSKMVNELGFGNVLTPMRLGNPIIPSFLRSTEKEKDKEINKIFEALSKETETLILENKSVIEDLSELLRNKKTLYEKELNQFFMSYKKIESSELEYATSK